MRNLSFRFLLLATCLGSTHLAYGAALLKAGDPLPILELKDQHDKPAVIAKTTQRLLFAADNNGGQKTTALIDSLGASWLKATGTVYLADIHRMPSLITKMFALPQLREKPYPILLGREEADLAMFPRKKDCVTLIQVRNEQLGEAVFACTEEELRVAVKR